MSNYKRHSRENAIIQSQARVVIPVKAQINEVMTFNGKYPKIILSGPKEHLRPLYLELMYEAREEFEAGNFERYDELRRQADALVEIKDEDKIVNLVPDAAKNLILDTMLAGSAYTAAWYMFLVDGGTTPTYAAGDLMSSHTGWTENTAYAAATRPAPTWSAAASKSKSTASAVTYSINGTATIAGCGLASNSTKGGTTGNLWSAGNFSGGNKAVNNGDTLSVSYTGSFT